MQQRPPWKRAEYEKIHLERIQFEKNFEKRKEGQLKRKIYQKLAEIGIGRTAIIYAKK